MLEHEAAMILRLSSNANTCSESRVTKARCWRPLKSRRFLIAGNCWQELKTGGGRNIPDDERGQSLPTAASGCWNSCESVPRHSSELAEYFTVVASAQKSERVVGDVFTQKYDVSVSQQEVRSAHMPA